MKKLVLQKGVSEEKLKKIKSMKAKANIQRDFVTRLADEFNDYFGSSGFLVANIIFFILWIVLNLGWIPGIEIFDPFPYVFLITFVSLEAIILSIFVLISQNRQTVIDDLREEVELQIALNMQEQNTKILKMLDDIEKSLRIQKPKDKELEKMRQKANPDRILEELRSEIDKQR